MKQYYVLALLFAFSGFFLLSAQEADPSLRLCRLMIDADLLSGPGKNFKTVRKAESGLLLEIMAEKSGYFRVHVPDGFQCYIHADYLEVSENGIGTVSGNNVNLRSIPKIKGDYPVFKVNRGDRLMVWEKTGEWYCVTAPEQAYLYAPEGAVDMVMVDQEAMEELDALRASRVAAWETLQKAKTGGLKRAKEEMREKDQALQTFLELEKALQSGFEGMDIKEAIEGYRSIESNPPDNATGRIAAARVGELEAVMIRKKAEDELKKKEDSWRKERRKLLNTLDKCKAVNPEPATHDSEGKGRKITVRGVVDTMGPEVVLRGGKSLLEILYRLDCPDGRYILRDFHGKRIEARCRVSEIASREKPVYAVVERLAIL